ncbi:MAG: class A beta-lactamase-related serine hydrolase [Chitinophagaceae bacterium]|nr:MAG: class A beta-lactamase-related serine hydrolase [Chitinophagaceae bacterium]
MRCFLLLSCIALSLCAAGQQLNFRQDYQPAAFTDTGRLEKIKKLLPAIDSIYREHALSNHYPGMVYGVVVDGQLIAKGGFGYLDTEKKNPVTSSSLFRIASMTKSFTSMAILRLRDEGRLSLDDPAEKYIPEMKSLVYPTADGGLITIRHLLTHGAGFPEDNPWGDRQLADSDKELADFLKNKPGFSNPPGLEYEYSNLGFALLGRIITKVSGKPYQSYIREKIWKPLGMDKSEWEYDRVAPAQLAHGYRWLDGKWKEEALLHDTPDGSWGAMGSMITSIDEFAKYMALHLGAWPASNAPETGPVKRSSVREIQYPWRFNGLNADYSYPDGRRCATATAYGYGLGWTKDCEGRIYLAHSGGLPGFGSQWRIMPEYGIGVVAFANLTYAGFGAVHMRVLDSLVKAAGLKPRQQGVSMILRQRSNELAALLPDWENAETSGIFAENFFPDNPLNLLRERSRAAFKNAGKVIGLTEIIPLNQLRGTFRIHCENADVLVFFTLSPENPGLIQAFEIRKEEAPAAKSRSGIENGSALAATYFREAEAAAASQQLWKASLYGPMMFIDLDTRRAIANTPDSAGLFKAENGVYTGVLPKEVMLANTAIDWQGKKWSLVLWPAPANKNDRLNLMLHESFHRIQGQLGFAMNDPALNHLASMEGRIYFLLEMQALKAAVNKPPGERNEDLRSALIFRRQRSQLFPLTIDNERLMELHEGLAEFTGTWLGVSSDSLATHLGRLADNAEALPSLIRTASSISGPLYGCLLSQRDPSWTSGLNQGSNLQLLLEKAYGTNAATKDLHFDSKARERRYDGVRIRTNEKTREEKRLAQEKQYRRMFFDGPVLLIDLVKMNINFNPSNMFDLGDAGTVYPTAFVRDAWGELTVTDGMLMKDWKQVRLALTAGIDEGSSRIEGKGWTLVLNPGWKPVRAGNNMYTLVK